MCRAEVVLAVLKEQGLTIGEFLLAVLGDVENLSHLAKEVMKWFIQGCTKVHPITVVNAIYKHPYACPDCFYKPSFHPLPRWSVPFDRSQPNNPFAETHCTYGTLQKYFVAQAAEHVQMEVKQLLGNDFLRTQVTKHEGGKFDWNAVLTFSIATLQQTMMELAPVTWMLLTGVALGIDEERATMLQMSRTNSKQDGKGSNNTRDPYLVCET